MLILMYFLLGAKLSVFVKLSDCFLGAKLSDFTTLMPNCPGVKLCKIVLPLIRGKKYDKM